MHSPGVPPPHLTYSLIPPGGNSGQRAVSWVVIIVSVALLVWSNWTSSPRIVGGAVPSAQPDLQVELTGRYAIGLHAILVQTGNSDSTAAAMVAPLDTTAKTFHDKLGAVVIAGDLLGKDEALRRLDALTSSASAKKGDATTAALRRIYMQGPQDLSAEQRKTLETNLGWLAEVAESFGKPGDDPQRAAVLSAAKRTVITVVVAFAAVVIGFLAGIVLLIVLMVRLADKKLQLNYRPDPDSVAYSGAGFQPAHGLPDEGLRDKGGVFLECFAIYVGGMTGLTFAGPWLPGFLRHSLVAHVALMVIPTLLAIVWPLLRGTGTGLWRYALGWHAGRGVLREMGLGLVGYLAGLPVVAAGIAITFFLIAKSGATPSHPIQYMLNGGTKLTLMVYLLASVYAPLTEETMFRGAFFHALRGRHGWLVSALLTSFIFAAIHPQGWTVVPTLMAIAIVFAAIREWRGTILASATAHCVHNTILVTVAIMVMH